MSNYSGMIVKLENVQKHPFADRLLVAIAAEEPVVIGLGHETGEVGVFFPAGTILNHQFLMENKLYRKNPANDEPMGGYFESNRRVRFQKFRNAMSRGIWLPLSSLDYLCLQSELVVGTEFSELEGHEIVQKYIEPSARPQIQGVGKPRSKRYVGFYEIGETPKLVMNYHRFDINDVWVITEKLHGTSGRTGWLEQIQKPEPEPTRWQDKLYACWEKFWLNHLNIELIIEKAYGYVTGTRRMVIGENSPDENNYRLKIHELLKPHLSKGMIVYYEIVGRGIMQTHTPNGIGDDKLRKSLIKSYGEEINYTYGVPSDFYDFYIYKIVEHNVDDIPIVYSWDQVVKWCKQHDLKHVPVLATMLYEVQGTNVLDTRPDYIAEKDYLLQFAKERAKELINFYCEGASILDVRHPKEGVVIQTKYGPFKHKSDVFCILEDIRPYAEPELEVFEDEETNET